MRIDTRWRKALRDVIADRGRALALLVALVVGVFTVGTMLGAYGIVAREIGVNYARTNPASATIEVDEVTPAALTTARSFPGIALVEARAVVEARARVGEEWMRMLLFVAGDSGEMRLNTFDVESGAWPPPAGTMLVERLAADVLNAGEGGSVTIRTPNGAPQSIPVAGVVHDTTLAPAWQEQTGYGYITRETLAMLDDTLELDELRIQLEGNPMDTAIIDAKALELAEALRAQGVEVHAVKAPPPGEHPHEGQMLASLRTFVTFSGLALVLAAILVAAVLAAILARQVREIGVMKAVGARSGQIASIYAVMLIALGGLATAIGLPAGLAAATGLSRIMADTMNFTVTNTAIPAWVYAVLIGAGLFLPLAVSMRAITRASRATVRQALDNVGTGRGFGGSRFAETLAAFGGIGLPYLLAIRNMFRRRGRLVVALVMLSVGGGLYITSLSVRDGWREMAGRVMTDRLYDTEFLLSEPVEAARIERALAGVEGIGAVEVWGYNQTAFAQEGRIDVMRTYPDRGHGSFALYGVPPQTGMIRFPIVEGRWLQEGDIDAVVLTPSLMRQIPQAKVGDRVLLSIEGGATEWRIVGVALQVGGNGAYVTSAGYERASGMRGMGGDVLVAAAPGEDRGRVVRAAESALDAAGIGLERGMPLERLHVAMIGHVEVPVAMLIAASVLLALIGGIGLASMMTINVLERTRELGVMKAIGATPRTILTIVSAESVFIAAVSWVFALILALPLIRGIGLLGARMFGAPLPFTVSASGAAGWLGLVLVIALVASAAPALRAARLVVREALAYE
jgi:putative ABC transport system permease protein